MHSAFAPAAQRSQQPDSSLLIAMLSTAHARWNNTMRSACGKSAAGRTHMPCNPPAPAGCAASRTCYREVLASLSYSRASAWPMQTSTDCRPANSVSTECLPADHHVFLHRCNLPQMGCTNCPVLSCLASNAYCSLQASKLQLMPHLSCNSCNSFSAALQDLHSHTHCAARPADLPYPLQLIADSIVLHRVHSLATELSAGADPCSSHVADGPPLHQAQAADVASPIPKAVMGSFLQHCRGKDRCLVSRSF